MTYDDLIAHYGSQVKAAEAVDTYAQVLNGWRERGKVPLDWQLKYEADSAGKLKADVSQDLRRVLAKTFRRAVASCAIQRRRGRKP